MHRWDYYVSIYMQYINSVPSTMWPGALIYIYYTLLAYAPEQICLPYCTYMSHCTSNIVCIQTHITAHIKQNSINCNIYLPYYCKICASKNISLKCHILNYFTCINGGSMQIYTTNELASFNHMTRSAVHRQQSQQQCKITITMMTPTTMIMMLQPNCIDEFAICQISQNADSPNQTKKHIPTYISLLPTWSTVVQHKDRNHGCMEW